MALIVCPDCGSQVSDKAVSCPSCAHPVHGATVIEQTAKRWKMVQAIGALGMVLGLGSIFALARVEAETGYYVSVVFIALSGVVCLVGRFGAWWYHG